jgi:predicted Rdx family selenoprotein
VQRAAEPSREVDHPCHRGTLALDIVGVHVWPSREKQTGDPGAKALKSDVAARVRESEATCMLPEEIEALRARCG